MGAVILVFGAQRKRLSEEDMKKRVNDALRLAIEDILLIAECSLDGEWEGQVRYLPL